MDMVGKAMFSQQVGKLKEDFGFKDDEEKEESSNYDPGKWAEEDAKLADQRAKRKEDQSKRQADRAANRNKIREKYGLKQSKYDQNLVTQREKGADAPPPADTSAMTRSPSSHSTSSKKEEKCAVM